MKSHWIKQANNRDLIVFFGGWGTDPHPFSELDCQKNDILMFYAYSNLSIPVDLKEVASNYENIHLIAWSLGVAVAEIACHQIASIFSTSTAINGTSFAIDSQFGIPAELFAGTIESLNNGGLKRFNRRMLKNHQSILQYNNISPKRNIDDQKNELIFLKNILSAPIPSKTRNQKSPLLSPSPPPPNLSALRGSSLSSSRPRESIFQHALIGLRDSIFSPDNQQRCWKQLGVPYAEIDAPHFPFFQFSTWREILHFDDFSLPLSINLRADPDLCIDKELVRVRFGRRLTSYNDAAVVQKEMAVRLIEFITKKTSDRSFNKVLEIGCGTGLLTKMFLNRFNPNHMFINDIVDECKNSIDEIANDFPLSHCSFIPGDAESIPIPPNLDMIVSNATFQWLVDQRKFIDRLHACLNPNGLLAISTFAPETLKEISDITGTGLRYHTLDDYKKMLQSNFEILFIDSTKIQLLFDSPRDVLQHLQKCGVTGLSKQRWTKKDFKGFDSEYRKRFSDSEKVSLTYCPLYVIARKGQHK